MKTTTPARKTKLEQRIRTLDPGIFQKAVLAAARKRMDHFASGVRRYRDDVETALSPEQGLATEHGRAHGREVWRRGGAWVRCIATPERATQPPIIIISSPLFAGVPAPLNKAGGLANSLGRLGHPVYLFGWQSGDKQDMALTLHTFVLERLAPAMAALEPREKNPVLLGHGFGGHLVAALRGLVSGERASGPTILVNCPWNLHAGHPLLSALVPAMAPALTNIIQSSGMLPGNLLSVILALLAPFDTGLRMRCLANPCASRDQANHALNLQKWMDAPNHLPAGMALPFLSDLFEHNKPPRGDWLIGNTVVDLSEVPGPLLVIGADQDSWAPSPSLADVTDRIDAQLWRVQGGHVDVLADNQKNQDLGGRLSRWIVDNMR